MALEMTSKEFSDAIVLVDGLSNDTLADALEDLALREREMAESFNVSPEVREILLYNFSILASAATRIRHNMNAPDSTSAKP